jgi:hypothetical protein
MQKPQKIRFPAMSLKISLLTALPRTSNVETLDLSSGITCFRFQVPQAYCVHADTINVK